MCNCHETIPKILEKRVLESIKNEIGFTGITHSGFENEVLLMLGDGPKVPIVIPFEVEYQRVAKTSGKLRNYKKKVNYFPSFCPSCGEKYVSEVSK